MTPEDLQQARMHLWHQDGTPLLTTEDVHGWLDQIGFCSLLPSTHPLASLAQATGGNDSATPEQEALRAAHQLTAQLLSERAAVPLLWEETSMLTGEQYDALASAEVLPYLYCLRGDRDLKKTPQGSPLVQAVWQVLEDGSKTVAEIVIGVGRELTEAAVLRALRELWTRLRVIPVLETVPSEDGARWDLLQRVFPDAVKQGAGMSQPLAVSAMVSVYLNGAVAATAEEVEDALGPLASRSRVREVLNALQATRQLTMLPVGRSSAYALAGGGAEVLSVVAEKRDHDELKKARAEAKVAMAGRTPREFGERKAWAKDRGIAARTRPRSDKAASGEAGGDGPVGDRPVSRRPLTGERKEWKPREGGSSFAARKPYVKREGAGEKREWKPRTAGAGPSGGAGFGARKPYVKRDSGDAVARKPWVKREEGDRPARKPFVKREGGDFKPRSFSDRPAGERKEWKPRANGDRPAGAGFPARKPFVKRDSGDFPARKPFVKREGNYPPRAARPERPAGERREWKDRPAAGGAGTGERKPWVKRESVGDKRFDRKPGGFAKKPFGAKPGGKTFGGAKSFGGPKKFGSKPFGAKPGGFARKPGGFAKKPLGAAAGAPAKRVYKRKDEDA